MASSFTSIPAIPERSDATPGLWNSRFSQIDINVSALQQSLNVRSFGAKGDGTTDDWASLMSCYQSAVTGQEIFYPYGTYSVSSTLVWNKQLKHRGFAIGDGGGSAVVAGSIISGTGMVIVRAPASFLAEDLCIKDTVGNANTVALSVEELTGTVGVANWSLRNCYLNAPHTAKLGTGLRCIFGLKGSIHGGNIEGWGIGVDSQSTIAQKSNAISFFGTKIRCNLVGVKTTDVDNMWMFGVVNEGNGTGYKHESGMLTIVGGHAENNSGLSRNIHVTGGNLSTFGVLFGSGSAGDGDIYVESGAGRHVSTGDALVNAINHNGSGIYTINPVNSLTTKGTGPISRIDGNGIQGIQGLTGQVLTLSGYAYISTALPIVNNAGATAIGGSTGVTFLDVNQTPKASVNSIGCISAGDGSASLPGIRFLNEPQIGFYRSGARTASMSASTLDLATNAARLSMRTLAASSITASAAQAVVQPNEVVFTVGGASGASLCINSGGTTYYFNSAGSAKNT